MQRFFIIIVIIFFFGLNSFSQNPVEDSLLIELKNSKSDTSKVLLMLELYSEFRDVNTDKGYAYLVEAEELAKKSNYKFGIGRCYACSGEYYMHKGEYKHSKEYYNKALQIYEELSNTGKIIASYTRLGDVECSEGNYEAAMEWHQKSLDMLESFDNKFLKANTYVFIAHVYFYKGDFQEAIEYYSQSLEIFEEIGDKEQIAFCLNNIGNVYANFGEYSEALGYYQKSLIVFEELNNRRSIADAKNNIGLIHYFTGKPDLAIQYFRESSEVYEELGYNSGLINSYNNIGNIYEEKGNLDEAIIYLSKAGEYSSKSGDKRATEMIYFNIGNVYLKKNDLNRADEFYKKALDISVEIGKSNTTTELYLGLSKIQLKLRNPNYAISLCTEGLQLANESGAKRSIRESYQILAEANEMLNNYKEALEYFKLFKAMHDSIFNEENSNQLNELETKYQTEKKQQQIELQETKLRQQETVRNSLIGGLVAIVIIAFLAISAYFNKRRSSNKIALQRDKIEKQKDEISAKNKSITDSIEYASRIQSAILPSQEYVEKVLPEHFILFRPRDIVSGDFYWIKKINNLLVIAAADCTGHGVPGAFMSMLGVSFLNEIVARTEVNSANEVLNQLRKSVKQTLGQEGKMGEAQDGMDIAMCVVDLDNMKMQYSGAYNPLYLFRNNEFLEIKADKMPIGIYLKEKESFTNHEVDLQKGDTFYIFSDGYQDQFGGEKGGKFKTKNYKQLLLDIHQKPMSEQCDILDSTIDDWRGEWDQIDDIIIVGVRV